MTGHPSPQLRPREPNCPPPGHGLCRLNELQEGTVREFAFGAFEPVFRMIVLRSRADLFAYVNRCPHASLPLNQRPDEFLSRDGRLMCRRHFALFRVEDGLCVSGACLGAKLTPLALVVDAEGMVRLG